MKHLYQKQQHLFPGKAYWHACRRLSYPEPAYGPDLHGPKLLVAHQQGVLAEREVPAESKALQQWLQAGGKADAAALYDVEIFVEMV
jgi:hypothetical protein